ncbi:MAG: membrane protein [Cyanobium sp. CACIAM 14]|nr:MAG: membrane protein [Cyanobium sp. CACIAM 14]
MPPLSPVVAGSPAGAEQNPQLNRRLQQDSIQLAGKTVFLNPFLYWRRFDANTDRWLREPGQLPEEQIRSNRLRFYPELDWDALEPADLVVKEGAVEMFLKSLELISTFNPDLTAGHLLEVERKMAVTKKKAFERWVARALERREKESLRERRRFDRERLLRGWMEWLFLDGTRQALLPFSFLLVLAVGAGWWLGSTRFCAQVIVSPGVQRPAP